MAEQTPLVYVSGRTVRLPAGDTTLAAAAVGAAADGIYKLRRTGGVYSWELDNGPTWVWLSADSPTNTTVTLVNSLLTFPVVAGGIYWFRAYCDVSTLVTTTGFRVVPNGPAFTRLRYMTERATNATTTAVFYTQTAWQQPTTATANTATNGAQQTIEGIVTASAAGSVTIQYATEIAGSAVALLAGSNLQYKRVN